MSTCRAAQLLGVLVRRRMPPYRPVSHHSSIVATHATRHCSSGHYRNRPVEQTPPSKGRANTKQDLVTRVTTASLPPAASPLTSRVHALVGKRDTAGAVRAVRESLYAAPDTAETFTWPALSAALFACADASQAEAGLALVRDVRLARPQLLWTDESVLAVVLRLQCTAGDVAGATRMFTYLLQNGLLKPRTASPFLRFACTLRAGVATHAGETTLGTSREGAHGDAITQEDRNLVFAVYEACLSRKVELDHDDYLALGRFCVAYGEPRRTLHFMLARMQEHVAEVSETFVRDVLKPWCVAKRFEVSCATAKLPFDAASPDTAVDEECDASHGRLATPPASQEVPVCPHCQHALGGYPFSSAARSQLLSDLVNVVVPQKCRSRRASVGFEAWRRFVSQRQGGGGLDGIDVLIDGANLGYYGLSSWYEVAKRGKLVRQGRTERDITARDLDFDYNCKKGGCGVDVGVSFALIDLAIRVTMEPANGFRRPLVLLHERHCEPHNMSAEEAAYVHRWRSNGWLYCTPTGLNDDLCWLYAALKLTKPCGWRLGVDARNTARQGGSNPKSREEVRQVFVMTNDLMRDHHFALLSPRCFRRWRDEHQLRFRCAYRRNGRTEMELLWPAPFTRCIQRVEQESDEGELLAGWHVPFYYGAHQRIEGARLVSTPSDGTDPDAATDERTSWLCLTDT